MSLVITKSGVQLSVIAAMADGVKLVRVCDCDACKRKERFERYRLLPCGCHGLVVECSCRVHEKVCKACGRIFVASKPYTAGDKRWVDVYEIEDPHGANAVL